MRVLIAYGSKHGGTRGIAHLLAQGLEARGHEVRVQPARERTPLEGYDAVIVGGALYANRWHPAARRFVARNVTALRRRPVWFFSSGPLDDSAERTVIEPAPQVAALIERVGALGHVTFGGRLAADSSGFPAQAMAKTMAGDFRNPARIDDWAAALATAVGTARSGYHQVPGASGWGRTLAYGFGAWAFTAAIRAAALGLFGPGAAFVLTAIFGPAAFIAAAWACFGGRTYLTPFHTAAAMVLLGGVLDLALIALTPAFAPFRDLGVMVLPALVLAAAWATGEVKMMIPRPSGKAGAASAPLTPATGS